MFVYFVKAGPRRNVCPDVFVARDVDNDYRRRSYKVRKMEELRRRLPGVEE